MGSSSPGLAGFLRTRSDLRRLLYPPAAGFTPCTLTLDTATSSASTAPGETDRFSIHPFTTGSPEKQETGKEDSSAVPTSRNPAAVIVSRYSSFGIAPAMQPT